MQQEGGALIEEETIKFFFNNKEDRKEIKEEVGVLVGLDGNKILAAFPTPAKSDKEGNNYQIIRKSI